MKIHHLGRLVGAGLVALSLSSLAPHAAAGSFGRGMSADWHCFAACPHDDDGNDGFDAFGGREFGLSHNTSGLNGPTWERIARSLFPHGGGQASDRGHSFDGRTITAPPTITAAVPEPQTWALLLAGLAAVLFIGARKRSRD